MTPVFDVGTHRYEEVEDSKQKEAAACLMASGPSEPGQADMPAGRRPAAWLRKATARYEYTCHMDMNCC